MSLMNGSWKRGVGITALAILLGGCAAPTCTGKPSNGAVTPAAATSPVASSSPSPSPTASLAITPVTFHAGEVGAAYLPVAMAASGGQPPYTWTLGAGALPDGLVLGADGSVSGSPTSSGHFTFAVQAADSGGSAVTLAGSITIAPALSASLLPACARACQVEAGCVDVCGAFGQLSGGTGPFTYAANGYVPPGVRLGGGLAYVGTFTRPVSYWQSTVTVTDSFGETASLSPIFNVFPHIALAGGLCQGSWSSGCTVKLRYTGGSGQVTGKVTAIGQYCSPTAGCYSTPTAPPAGLGITGGGGTVTFTVPSGNPNGYAAVLTVVVTDSSPCSGSTSCSSTGAQVSVVISPS